MLDFPVDETHYPSSDGEPLGENDVIWHLMVACSDMLTRHFQDHEMVYVSSNSFVYYVKGDPKQRVAPDLYVVKGVSSHQRHNYKIWEEGVVPQVVFEFTTESSRYKDLGLKKGLYEALGVKEYYLFDPAAEYLSPPFRAFVLKEGNLVEREQKGSFFSQELQLTIKPQDKLLRFYEPDSLVPVPTSQELQERLEAVEHRIRAASLEAEGEKQRADSLEYELTKMKAEIERLKRDGS